MSYIEIIALTVIIMWTVNFIATMISEDVAFYIAMGLVYPLINILLYPLRAWVTYSRAEGYFEKHGITKLQYVLGKRVKADKED